jgi:hypothetical protein
MAHGHFGIAREAVLAEIKEMDLPYRPRHVLQLSTPAQEVFELSAEDGRHRGSVSVFFEADAVVCVKVRTI